MRGARRNCPGAEGHSRGPSRHFAGDGGTAWKRGVSLSGGSGRRGDVSEVKEHYWGGGAKVVLRRKRERDGGLLCLAEGSVAGGWDAFGVALLVPFAGGLGRQPLLQERLGEPVQAPKSVVGAPFLSTAAGTPGQPPSGPQACRRGAPFVPRYGSTLSSPPRVLRGRPVCAPLRDRLNSSNQGPRGGAGTPCRLGVLLSHALGKSGVADREWGGGGPGPESPLLLPTRHCGARRSC